MTLRPERKRLTNEQINLVKEVVEQRAPHLGGSSRRSRRVTWSPTEGHVVSDAEMHDLSDVVSYVMPEETDKGGEYTERGLALDDLIGILWQWSEGYFK